jgi:hypothetical protein
MKTRPCHLAGSRPRKKMKTYNINPQQIIDKPWHFYGIRLGEQGEGRTLSLVPTAEESGLMKPAILKNGRIGLESTSSDSGWVLRISTESPYVKGGNGNVSTHPDLYEKIYVVARGTGAAGLSGRLGNWDDLLIWSNEEWFFLRVEPANLEAHILLFSGGNVLSLTYEEAERGELDLLDSNPRSMGSFIRL